MREAPALLAVVARKLHAVDGGGRRGGVLRQTAGGGGVVRGPGKLAVRAPEPVEFQLQLWAAAGVVSLRRRRRRRLAVRAGAAVVVPVTTGRRGGRYAIVRRSVDRHLAVSEFSVVACKKHTNNHF